MTSETIYVFANHDDDCLLARDRCGGREMRSFLGLYKADIEACRDFFRFTAGTGFPGPSETGVLRRLDEIELPMVPMRASGETHDVTIDAYGWLTDASEAALFNLMTDATLGGGVVYLDSVAPLAQWLCNEGHPHGPAFTRQADLGVTFDLDTLAEGLMWTGRQEFADTARIAHNMQRDLADPVKAREAWEDATPASIRDGLKQMHGIASVVKGFSYRKDIDRIRAGRSA